MRKVVSPVEQYTIDCEYLAYSKGKKNSKKKKLENRYYAPF